MTLPLPALDACPRRHTLIHPRREAWMRLMDARPELAAQPLVRDWVAHGWPLIARRPSAHERRGIAVGLPLPPLAGKARIALMLEHNDIVRTEALPMLAATIDTAPAAWRSSLHALVATAAAHQVAVRVFGSLAWQYLTGLTYLSATSDVDLAWCAPSHDRLDPVLRAIDEIERAAPMGVDGEIVLRDGAAANWRELLDHRADVMLKTSNDVILATRLSFEQGLT
ncbi:malonate decarboxylase holo-[acyl-carrier-protein] synthase [Alcaligenaceae bacterium A4P071]|nr:malonate decarboxylase holo-[acyl-carrier-protein] synthase [Alcaligenaceae bacterium A4P071]